MVFGGRGVVRDMLLRAAGVALLACCWATLAWLFRHAHPRQHQDPSFVAYMAAATGFLCFSAGAVLTALGAHVFDQVEVSERWARQSWPRPDERAAASAPHMSRGG